MPTKSNQSTNEVTSDIDPFKSNKLTRISHSQAAIIRRMMALSGLSCHQCGDYLFLAIAAIRDQLLEGIETDLQGFGTFKFVHRPGRVWKHSSVHPEGFEMKPGLRLKFVGHLDFRRAIAQLESLEEYQPKAANYGIHLKKKSQVGIANARQVRHFKDECNSSSNS